MKRHDEPNLNCFNETPNRLFFSLLLDDNLKETLIKLIRTLKKSSLCHYVHWTKPENLHITLHFIGNVPQIKTAPLISSVQEKIALLPTFNLQFTQILLFPPFGHPHVLVLGVKSLPSLLKLVTEIKQGVLATGISGDKKTYIPHLTLGKFKHLPPFTIPHPKVTFPILPVKEIALLKSVQTETGTIYQTVEKLYFSNQFPHSI